MATTVSTKPAGAVSTGTKSIQIGGTGRRPAGGNGSRGGPQPPNGGGGGGHRAMRDSAPQQYRIGMWLTLSAVLMMFAALSSAYVFRSTRMQQSWQAFSVPAMLWASTALILLSSATIEVARRSLKRGAQAGYRRWLVASLGLGLGFLVAQLLAWRGLVGQGIYLATNPHSSFFYLLTGLHAVHLCGGILGLGYLLFRARRGAGAEARDAAARQRARVDAVGLYWHFMDGLWVYLFALLFLWR
jgi:cytochrome c oxidase subunit 3